MSRPTVFSQRSTLRDLFPFYSADMVLFGTALVVIAYALMLWLDPPRATLVAVGGYVGMAMVNWTGRPSYMNINLQQQAVLTEVLKNIEYRYVPSKDHWVPPLPRWLRWKFNYVKFEPAGTTVRVVGPAYQLAYLADQLS